MTTQLSQEYLLKVARTYSLRETLGLKKALASTMPGFDSLAFARHIRTACRERAEMRDAWRDAEYTCRMKGHDYDIASGYQGLYDRGYDVPVTCRRCGNTEM